MAVPDRPTLAGLEDTWCRAWDDASTYAFDHSAPRERVYAIDTPPPTVSGTLHVGHVFSYTQTDLVARYQRMRGRAVCYPMGFDDNGLPTERRVQNHYGVRCDPTVPYDPGFRPPPTPFDPPVAVSRRTFVELCETLTAEDEQAFERLWRRLGLSVDWTLRYTTIGDRARALSQRMFLRNLARGEAYRAEAPTLWDVTYGTAVAQAELEDREVDGALHGIAFALADGGEVVIETTRPELLPGCVALVAHPGDERYAGLVGRSARVPMADRTVPVHAHPLAEPTKGTGIAMVCTFGDLTDVTWWRELALPTRPVMGRDGRLVAEPYAGLTARQARARVVDDLRAAGALRGEPRPVRHAVKFYEKGEQPLEIVTSRQWYIRNGGRDGGLREALLDRGRELRWHPEHMLARYEHWVRGLTGDWLVSRQRWFGVPIPVWYGLDADGHPCPDEVLVPDDAALPVDPAADCPPGYTESQRGRPRGFAADPDVMDTWATSSLTPYLVAGAAGALPLDLRPQAHEIIRTWLFATVLRAHLEDGVLPWRHVAVSGWVLDPDRKKMSKSRGAALTPTGVLDEYGADAVRYWAARGRLGTDTTFDTGQLRVGRRLATKVLNASRFVLGLAGAADLDAEPAAPVDRALLSTLAGVVADATAALDGYDHTRALEVTERFFWSFCDDYIELVKERAYGGAGAPGAASARATLARTLGAVLRLLAPYLPFLTEEVWSWWRDGSVHLARWPEAVEFAGLGEPGAALLDDVSGVLAAVRRAKTAARLGMRAPVSAVTATGPADRVEALGLVRGDLLDATRATELRLVAAESPDLRIDVRW